MESTIATLAPIRPRASNRRYFLSVFSRVLAVLAAGPGLVSAEPVPDAGFGSNGIVDIALPGASYLNPAHVAVLPDRRIAVARTDTGRDSASGALTASFARLLPDGRPDATFGNGGTVTFVLRPAPADYAVVGDIHMRADGSQFVLMSTTTGAGDPSPQSETRLLAVTADGRLDPAFNAGQPLPLAPFTSEKLFVDDNAVVVVGIDRETCCGHVTRLIARRLHLDGTPDIAFGAGGVLDVESTPAQIRDAMPVPGGGLQILFLEYTSAGERSFWRRYRANGSLDTAFGINGEAAIPTHDGFGLRRVYALGDGTWLGTEGSNCGRRILDAQGNILVTFGSTCTPGLASTSQKFRPHAWGERILMQGEQRTYFISLPSDGSYAWAVDLDGRVDAAFARPQDDTRWRIPGPHSASHDVAADGPQRFVVASAEFAENTVRVQRFVAPRGTTQAQPVPALGLPGLLLVVAGTAAFAGRRLRRRD